MAELNKSIVHLTMRFGTQALSIGTGTLYRRNDKYFIVTAWHNLTGLNSETLDAISTVAAVPDNVLVNMNISYPGECSLRSSALISLHGEEHSSFLIHPNNWPRIDVAVIPFDPANAEQEMRTIDRVFRQPLLGALQTEKGEIVLPEVNPVQKYLLNQQEIAQRWLEQIQVSQELFIPGYPQNITDRYMQPVWKRATVASSVQHGWDGERKFLVDSASQSGMPGAPVLLFEPSGRVDYGSNVYHAGNTTAVLAGVYVGRVGVTEKVDPQIGIVFHASVIDEIIDANCWAPLPQDLQINNRELERAILDQFKTASPEGMANINNDAMPSRFYVRSAVLNEIKGRASPKRVLDELLTLAKTYKGPYRDS
jgi:hypothetical protein